MEFLGKGRSRSAGCSKIRRRIVPPKMGLAVGKLNLRARPARSRDRFRGTFTGRCLIRPTPIPHKRTSVVKLQYGATMSREFYLLLLLLLTPGTSAPQRYGRSYTLTENPQLLLQIKAQNQVRYFHPYDLRKMQRTVVNLTDPKTKASHVYEGVALDQLVPLKAFASEGESIEIQFGSHQITRISGVDLESQTKLVVIDTVDGKQLSGYAP